MRLRVSTSGGGGGWDEMTEGLGCLLALYTKKNAGGPRVSHTRLGISLWDIGLVVGGWFSDSCQWKSKQRKAEKLCKEWNGSVGMQHLDYTCLAQLEVTVTGQSNLLSPLVSYPPTWYLWIKIKCIVFKCRVTEVSEIRRYLIWSKVLWEDNINIIFNVRTRTVLLSTQYLFRKNACNTLPMFLGGIS